MAVPADKVKPAINYTHPSERAYFDMSKSTPDAMVAVDPLKTGGDYGIKDAPVVEPLAGNKTENGK